MAPSIPKTMKAWQYAQVAGGLEKNLKLNINTPLPPKANSLGPDQVLVQVLFSALNPVDYKLPQVPIVGGLVFKRPAVPGLDYAGRVVAAGPNSRKISSEDLQPGQLVFGRLNDPTPFGTLAEYCVVPRSGCVPLPQGVSPDDAAATTTTALTAYQTLVPNIKSGDRVFINGGSGGVGCFGIQFAKIKGCHVVTSCSGANADLCKSLGADQVIDYRTQDVVAELKKLPKFDFIADNVGTPDALYWQAHAFTKPKAKFVQVGADMSLGAMVGMLRRMVLPAFLGGGKRPFAFLSLGNNYEHFGEIAGWLAEGRLRAVIDEVYGMEE